MKICRHCLTRLPDSEDRCSDHAAFLLSIEESTDAMIGVRVADRYLVLAKIGEGGIARVYRARQLSTDRDVALKILSDVRDQETQRRFLLEARATAQLRSRHTVIIY